MPDLRVMARGVSDDSEPAAPAERKLSSPGVPSWAALLGLFYSAARIPFPHIVRLKGHEMPQPYRSLLVHSRDMTPTLERFHQCSLELTVLSRRLEDDTYLREVTLDMGESRRPVEYGAIRIFLSRFPASARESILQERFPLGKILYLEGIPHVGWPQAFFKVNADPHMASLLRINSPTALYGRRNVLLDGSRHLLAEVIEVLPPAPNSESPPQS